MVAHARKQTSQQRNDEREVSSLSRRIKKASSLLKRQPAPSALLVSSARLQPRSRDTAHAYRQNSDFFYFTGIHHQDAALLISPTFEKPILFAKKATKEEILWDGKPPSLEPLARRLDLEHRLVEDPKRDILACLSGIDHLYANNDTGTLAEAVSSTIFSMPGHTRHSLPLSLSHAELLMMELRLYKDSLEIENLQKAITLTWKGLQSCVPIMKHGATEASIKAALEGFFVLHGSHPSFPSIVASGKNAAVLHYHDHCDSLRKDSMLLIDCGAEHNIYAGDITRVFPVGGSFSKEHRRLYAIVLDAQKAAIDTIAHNVPIKSVYDAAALVLTEGLKELKVLKGATSTLLKEQAYRPYFPHGIGHSLGLDVHDIGKLRGNNKAVLKKGMVFTVEPGLYFPRKAGRLSACGVRIEDDILVTQNGTRNLSAQIPKEIEEIEALFQE